MAVNLSPVGGAAAQFFTNSGVILSGGKLNTYLAGTTTPATTYTTSAGNVARTNPIVLDAAGRVPGSGEIWLTVGVTYKFVLTDSNNVLIGTYDNVTSAVNTDASLVSYTPAGTGAVTTTVQAKLRQYTSAQDFGAVGDGVTDDTVALQNCFTYANSTARVAFLPAGVYLISGPLTAPAPGIEMENAGYGSGAADSYIKVTGTGYTALTITYVTTRFNVTLGGTGNAVNGILLQQPILGTFNKIRVYNLNGFGVKINRCFDCTFEHISVELCGNASEYAFSMNDDGDTCNMSHIMHLQVELSNRKAIYISPNTVSCVFDNIHSERQTPNVADTTWVLGGNRCLYNAGRYESLATASDASLILNAANTTFTNLLVEGAIPVIFDAYSSSGMTLITPEIQGTLRAAVGQSGLITIIGGTIATIQGQNSRYNVNGTRITTLSVGTSSFNRQNARFQNCAIASLVSTTADSAATFDKCIIAEGNTMLTVYEFLNSQATFAAASTDLSFQTRYLVSSQFTGNIIVSETTGGGYIIDSAIVGNYSSTANLTGWRFVNTSVSGTAYTAPPNVGTWVTGDRHTNPKPTVGQPKSWVVTVSGTPGTWTSEGNL